MRRSPLPEKDMVLLSQELQQALMRLAADSDVVVAKLAGTSLREMVKVSPSLIYSLQSTEGGQAGQDAAGIPPQGEGWSGIEWREDWTASNIAGTGVGMPAVKANKLPGPGDVSVDLVKVVSNSMFAGVGGGVWGYLRAYRQLSRKTLVPLAGTPQRAFSAATLTAVGSVFLSLVHSAEQLIVARSFLSSGATLSRDFLVAGSGVSAQLAAISVALAFAPFSFGGNFRDTCVHVCVRACERTRERGREVLLTIKED